MCIRDRENSPSVNGKRDFVIVAGATMDNQMVYDLFHNTIQAATLMNEHKSFTDSLQTCLLYTSLYPVSVTLLRLKFRVLMF